MRQTKKSKKISRFFFAVSKWLKIRDLRQENMHLQCTCNANAMHLHKTPIDYQRVTTIKFLSSQKNYVFMCIFALREDGAGEK
nr:MAG TPA: hypothetical protein [Caudoviricetes sp.]